MAEANSRIKINKLLEEAGWRFFDNSEGQANIALEPSVKIIHNSSRSKNDRKRKITNRERKKNDRETKIHNAERENNDRERKKTNRETKKNHRERKITNRATK